MSCLLVLCRCSDAYSAALVLRAREYCDCFGICNEADTSYPGIFVNIGEDECREVGATKLTLIGDVTAWDKGVVFALRHRGEYANFWLMEDDVYVPSMKLFLELNLRFPKADLLCQTCEVFDKPTWSWHWYRLMHNPDALALPWARTLAQIVRLSSSFLLVVEEHLRRMQPYGNMIEYMFTTLALHAGSTVETPPELSKLGLKDLNPPMPDESDLVRAARFFYHPIKDASEKERLDLLFRGIDCCDNCSQACNEKAE